MMRFLAALAILSALLTSSLAFAREPIARTKKSAKANRLPAQVDLRPQFLAFGLGPRPQGNRGTCSVFATASALEFALARQLEQGNALSVEYLNWASNQAARDTNDGSFFHDCIKGFEQYGICLESEMPYQRQYDANITPPERATATAAQLRNRGLEVHWINPLQPKAGLTDEHLLAIKRVLAAGWPVAAGSSHSRLLVGYVDDANLPGGGGFITKDSATNSFDSISYQFTRENVGDVFWIESPPTKSTKRLKKTKS